MLWQWTTGRIGKAVDNLTDSGSSTAIVGAGERRGEGGRPARIVSQWKGSSYILLVVLSSSENSDPGLAV